MLNVLNIWRLRLWCPTVPHGINRNSKITEIFWPNKSFYFDRKLTEKLTVFCRLSSNKLTVALKLYEITHNQITTESDTNDWLITELNLKKTLRFISYCCNAKNWFFLFRCFIEVHGNDSECKKKNFLFPIDREMCVLQ